MDSSKGCISFHNCKFLFSYNFVFDLNVDDNNFCIYGKNLDIRHNFKGTELCVVSVVNLCQTHAQEYKICEEKCVLFDAQKHERIKSKIIQLLNPWAEF